MEKIQEVDILFLIKHLNKCLEIDLNNRLEKFGLTGPQGRIILYVKHFSDCGNPVCQNDLMLKFKHSKSTISGFIKRMEAKGFISKEMRGNQCLLRPTELANQMVKSIDDSRTETVDLMLKGFSKEEQDTIKSLVEKMIINLKGDEHICGIK